MEAIIINKEILEKSIENSTNGDGLYTEEYEGGYGGGYYYKSCDLSELSEEIIKNYISLSRENNIDIVENNN